MAIGIAYAIHVSAGTTSSCGPAGRASRGRRRRRSSTSACRSAWPGSPRWSSCATLIFNPIHAIRDFGIYSVVGITAIFVVSLLFIPAALLLLPDPHGGRAVGGDGARPRSAAWSTRSAAGPWHIGRRAGRRHPALRDQPVGRLAHPRRDRLPRVLQPRERLPARQHAHRRGARRHAADLRQHRGRRAGSMAQSRNAGGDARPAAVHRASSRASTAACRSPTTSRSCRARSIRERGRGAAGRVRPTSISSCCSPNPTDVAPVVSARLRAAPTSSCARACRARPRSAAFVQALEDVRAVALPARHRGARHRQHGAAQPLGRRPGARAGVGPVAGAGDAAADHVADLHCRSARGLLSLVPNVIPIIVLFGIMGWAGITLNISTSMIAVIAIGIAVDDTIHYFSEFNVQLRATGDQEQRDPQRRARRRQADRLLGAGAHRRLRDHLPVELPADPPFRHSRQRDRSLIGLVAELLITPALVMSDDDHHPLGPAVPEARAGAREADPAVRGPAARCRPRSSC